MIKADGGSKVDLLIVGASTRSAAFSALRSGLRPLCLDLFADADLKAATPVQQLHNLDDDLKGALKRLPSMPLIYVGGIENREDVLRLADEHHILWGNAVDVVHQVRDPRSISEAARLARVGFPEWRDESNPPPADGNWIIRPRLGSGGLGIEVWNGSPATASLKQPHLFQRKVEGVTYSAAFIADRAAGDVRFIGITRQLTGETACNARPFQWCGNIGPVSLEIPVESVIRRFANVLKWKFGIQGLFGIDFIIDPQSQPWVLEVNPRYPASLELLEHATGTPLLAEHGRCFDPDAIPARSWNRPHPGEFLGKAVFYAHRAGTIRNPLSDAEDYRDFPQRADLPEQGVQLQVGDPVCTLYATAASSDQTWHALQTNLAQLHIELDATLLTSSPLEPH